MGRQVVENLRLDVGRNLPEVLCGLHPANRVEPALPIGSLLGNQRVRMTATAMRPHGFPSRRLDQAGVGIDIGSDRRLNDQAEQYDWQQAGHASTMIAMR
jgi:hypothetical protein